MGNSAYEKIKGILATRVASTKYFSRAFFNTFEKATKAVWKASEDGIDDWYPSPENPNVLLRHSFDPVYESRFYRDNSCGYCEFLSVYHEIAKRSYGGNL